MNIYKMAPEHLSEYITNGVLTSFVPSIKGVYPNSYLEYAKIDISTEISRRTIVNALSNAKRAFHFQVDIICDSFGWKKYTRNRRYGFPEKLEYLSRCGIISPNILLKINRVRNTVEHEYNAPSEEELRDYIDIVELFLMATKILTDRYPESIDFELMQDEYYDTALDLPESISIKIAMHEGGIELRENEEMRKISIDGSDYYPWLAAIVSNYLR